MSTSLKEVCEQRGKLFEEIKKFHKKLEDGGQWTAEEEANWNELQDDWERLSGLKDKLERMADIEERVEKEVEEQNDPKARAKKYRGGPPEDTVRTSTRTPDPEDQRMAINAWGKAGKKPISDEERRAANRAGINLASNVLDLKIMDSRAVREMRANLTATTGGETVDTEFMREWEKALLAFGGMRRVARVIRTATGAALTWPKVDDTAVSAAILAEEAALVEQDITTASLVLNSYKYQSLIKVSNELMEDSAFNLAAELGEMLGIRVARGTHAHYTTGTGTGQPNGFVTAATEVNTTTAGQNFIVADLFELFHSVDPAYRDGPSVAWMAHDSIIRLIREFAETTGQYLWQPGLQAGAPDRLFGRPIYVNQNMLSVVATNNDILGFGDFSKYIIRDVGTVRVRRLDELYAGNDQTGFNVIFRTDGDALSATAIKVLNVIV